MRPEGEGVGCTQLAFETGSGKGLGAEVERKADGEQTRWRQKTMEPPSTPPHLRRVGVRERADPLHVDKRCIMSRMGRGGPCESRRTACVWY
jgi:hypothetical protein